MNALLQADASVTPRRTTVVGIDCATKPNNVGVALGTLTGVRVTVEQVEIGSRSRTPARIVTEWIREHAGDATLLALDAPLGWPAPLAPALLDHRAGLPLCSDANHLFKRATDHFITKRIGKCPFEVGASWIARTAHAALTLLEELREKSGERIPLAWDPAFTGVAAIEVYPAATWKAHGIDALTGGEKDREIIGHFLNALGERIALPRNRDLLQRNGHVRDAVGCALAAQDFLAGSALAPGDHPLAENEGWIWVRDPHGGVAG